MVNTTAPTRSSLYVIGIGGTGSKCLEAIIHLAAAGIFPLRTLKILFVDADESNGNLERSRQNLGTYASCQQVIRSTTQQTSWLQTEVKSYDLWSPFGTQADEKRLNSFFGYTSMRQQSPELADLFDVLYTPEEQKTDLAVGFRGRPAIGAAVMSQINLDRLNERPWSTLIGEIQQDATAGHSVRIILCGSIFGGTGASGLPTIGKLLSEKVNREGQRNRVKIGALFMLPYFQFAPQGGDVQEDEVFARSENFLINTEAALRYYTKQAEGTFDKVYLLGNENRSTFNFSIGKTTQKNDPHFLELYAALAAKDFLTTSDEESPIDQKVVILSRKSLGVLGWSDLPGRAEVRYKLAQATRFAYVWLDNLLPEFNSIMRSGTTQYSKIPWFPKFYKTKGGLFGSKDFLPDFSDPREQEARKAITNWCTEFTQWLYQIHKCDGDRVDLFMPGALSSRNGKGTYLNNLMDGDSRAREIKERDTIQTLLMNLEQTGQNLDKEHRGTIGLAKTLFDLCKI
ncbi:MAG: tubulin-like doman-containing protein [Prochlorotrichaceae cyanobacterium]|jgi:hypothetical protein